jgi:hypothetical protein
MLGTGRKTFLQNTGIYAVFTMLQDVVSTCEKDKNTVFYDVFARKQIALACVSGF